MQRAAFFMIATLAVLGCAFSDNAGERKEKAFSIFNIVSFKNTPCRSSSTISSGGGFRNGTCYTRSECTNLGGGAAGSCASGFGVCCVFTISASGSTISNNCTYIQNPNYPNAYSEDTRVNYRIQKCDQNVCGLRLDFESFTLQGPADSLEATGGECADDSLQITTTNQQTLPVICGQNSGQHIYLEFGRQENDEVTLDFVFTDDNINRNWEMKATQIPCNSVSKPPEGCFQWHTGIQGRFTTFNFIPTSDTSHLALQEYSICIRQEQGYCCVEYSQCQDANSFSINMAAAIDAGLAETSCTEDYIGISGSAHECTGNGAQVMTTNRYCGGNVFGTVGTVHDGSVVQPPVCDCTAPFRVEVKTDSTADAATQMGYSRGVCLNYRQVPCGA